MNKLYKYYTNKPPNLQSRSVGTSCHRRGITSILAFWGAPNGRKRSYPQAKGLFLQYAAETQGAFSPSDLRTHQPVRLSRVF